MRVKSSTSANRFTVVSEAGDFRPSTRSELTGGVFSAGPESLLIAHPIDRYLLNSPMLPQFVKDADGGLTFYVQNELPGKDKEPNWLPAPKGPFFIAMRLYWPKEAALDGSWKKPPMEKANVASCRFPDAKEVVMRGIQ